MNSFAIALGILSSIEHLVDLVNKIRTNAATTGDRELSKEERDQLDQRIANVGQRLHWKPTTPKQ